MASVPAITSSITAVTLYHIGARVTRTAILTPGGVDAGTDRITISGLPLCLDDASVQVRVEQPADGGTPVIVRGVRVGLDVPPEAPPKPGPTHDELDAAITTRLGLEGQMRCVAESLTRLDHLTIRKRPLPPESAPPPTPMQVRLALVESTETRRGELRRHQRALEKDLETALENEARIRRDIDEGSTERSPRSNEVRKCAHITFANAVSAPGPITLHLEYRVPGARWAPQYGLKFRPGFDGATLSVKALVCQQTGEDWSEVALALSTARDERVTQIPELPARRIGQLQASPPRTGWRPPPRGAEQLFEDYDQARRRLGGGECDGEPPPPPHPAPRPRREEKKKKKRSKSSTSRSSSLLSKSSPLADQSLYMEVEGAFGGAPPDAVFEEADELMEREGKKDSPVMARAAGAAPMSFAASMSVAPEPTRSRRSHRSLSAKSGGGSPPRRSPPPPPLTVDEDILDYGSLHAYPPDSDRRGKLVPRRRAELYLELMTVTHTSISIDLGPVLGKAQARAMAVGQKPPISCQYPDSVDGFDYAYRAEHGVSIPSDDRFHMVGLLTQATDSSLTHITVPRDSSDVYRVATVTNPLDAPLLAGPVDVSVGDEFLLITQLDTVAPGGKAEIGIGIEQGIKVARNVRYSEHTSGLLKGNLCLRHQIRVELRNNLRSGVRVEVRERIPVSAVEDDDLKVRVTEVIPDWEEFDQAPRIIRGGHRWGLTLEAGGTQALAATYEVHLTAKNQIVGGNRRES